LDFHNAKEVVDMEFEKEMTSYSKELFANALKFCKNEQDAADLLQDTYIKALKYKHNFEPGTNMRAWLYTIMRNTFINGYRRKKRFYEFLEEEKQFLEEEKEGLGNVSDDVLGRCEFQRLIDDLESYLEDCFFSVLVLVDVKNKSYKEAAALLEIPIGTIMSRLYRARKYSREYLLENYDVDLINEFVSKETIEERTEAA